VKWDFEVLARPDSTLIEKEHIKQIIPKTDPECLKRGAISSGIDKKHFHLALLHRQVALLILNFNPAFL